MRRHIRSFSPHTSRVIRVPVGCIVQRDRNYKKTTRKRAGTVPANIYPRSERHDNFQRKTAIVTWFGQGNYMYTAKMEDVTILPQVYFSLRRIANEETTRFEHLSTTLTC